MSQTFFTVTELAHLLRVSSVNLRLLIKKGEIQAVRIGSRHRIPASEVRRICGAFYPGEESSPDVAVNE